MSHNFLFAFSYRGVTKTLRWCMNSVYVAARPFWKGTPKVYLEHNCLSQAHISSISHNTEYCIVFHSCQLSVIHYILRGCRVDKLDEKPNNSIKLK